MGKNQQRGGSSRSTQDKPRQLPLCLSSIFFCSFFSCCPSLLPFSFFVVVHPSYMTPTFLLLLLLLLLLLCSSSTDLLLLPSSLPPSLPPSFRSTPPPTYNLIIKSLLFPPLPSSSSSLSFSFHLLFSPFPLSEKYIKESKKIH